MTQPAKETLWVWTKHLWDSAISGGSGAALAAFGLAGANSVGVAVTPLDYKQTGAIFLSGMIVEVLRFLKSKPSPDFDESGTSTNETDKPS